MFLFSGTGGGIRLDWCHVPVGCYWHLCAWCHSWQKSLWLNPLSDSTGIELQQQKPKKKMGKSCCVDDCKNRFNKNSELSFYRLPKAKEKRSKWIAAIHRHNWNPGPETWICSSHFVSGMLYASLYSLIGNGKCFCKLWLARLLLASFIGDWITPLGVHHGINW